MRCAERDYEDTTSMHTHDSVSHHTRSATAFALLSISYTKGK